MSKRLSGGVGLLLAAGVLAGCAAQLPSADPVAPAKHDKIETVVIPAYQASSADLRANAPQIDAHARRVEWRVASCISYAWRRQPGIRVDVVQIDHGRSVQASHAGEGEVAVADVTWQPRKRGSTVKFYQADGAPQALLGALQHCL
ncbi:MAG: hypothetical protein KGK15_03495 [Burkholderiales bacterium]|nr:hypothetical protein [Burkholderiales bacterium]MDE2287304.1 hypothetical protein [Burkholderiales bacterium]MDE2608472.1 hypothetical protein [Burkholderiales bacterium]